MDQACGRHPSAEAAAAAVLIHRQQFAVDIRQGPVGEAVHTDRRLGAAVAIVNELPWAKT